MATQDQLRARVQKATSAVLPAGPVVEVAPRHDGVVPVFQVTVQMGKHQHRFVAGWAGEGWPADVERFVSAAPPVDVVYAKRLSEGATEWLDAHHLGWVDEVGNAKISRPSGLVVSVEKPASKTERPPIGERWTRTMLATAEAILAGIPPTVEAVERGAHISRGASTTALERLESRGLLERPRSHRGPSSSRRIVDLDRLVDDYATAAAQFRAKQKPVLLHRLWRDPIDALSKEIGPSLRKSGARWAITGAAASTLLAPYLTGFTVVGLYVDHELFGNVDRLGKVLGGRLVDRGHRLEVRELPTAISDVGPTIQDISVALPVRVYADLLAAGGRSAEAAQHLREVRSLGPHS